MHKHFEQQDILKFWRDVEIFNLPDLNKDAALLTRNDALPWLQETLSAEPFYKWRYTLIFGKVEKTHILDCLHKILKTEEANDWEERMQGFSCFSALVLDENGCPQQDSYVTASYIFGINALQKEKELATVSSALEAARQDFLERYNIPQVILQETEIYPKGDVIYWEHIQREINYLKELTSWRNNAIPVFLLVEEVPKDSEPNSSFLNSFYLDDLNYLTHVNKPKLSRTLQQYLTLKAAESERKDLIQHKQFLFDTINPEKLTPGRWASKTAYGLYTAQSGAVNTIFSTLRNAAGIQGVNGPPGTGKTTLLLDVIAEIIVDRAKVISELGYNHLFIPGHRKIEQESGYTFYTYNLNPKLQNNFGIVIASNNNAAVENISKELPAKSKIDSSVFKDAAYFSECATKLIAEESWGVLAAALGNATNRSNFKKSFWTTNKKDNSIGFQDLLYDVYKNVDADKTPIHVEAFELENSTFNKLLNEFETFRNCAKQFHALLPGFLVNTKLKSSSSIELKNVEDQLALLAVEKKNLAAIETRLNRDEGRIQTMLKTLNERKPVFFFFQKLFNTASFKKWNLEAADIFIRLQNLTIEIDRFNQNQKSNTDKIQALSAKQKEVTAILKKVNLFFDQYVKLQNVLTNTYEIAIKNIFDSAFYEKDLSAIQLLNPYHSPKIAKLRSDIFLSALKLHEHVILANAKSIKNNLNAYFSMTAGWIKVDKEIAQNLWDTFFLCVPVVSTTLASASRLFPNQGTEQIGWLLIDEAGQATPQSAVGLIHRSKRCVIVGDPLQVEPVVTMPAKLMTKLRKDYKLPVEWSPHRVSVQQLADSVSQFGTSMKIGESDETIWTGFPLRTHRRCDEPMFSIANEIAYSNQMVKAINKNSDDAFIGASCWFDVNTEVTLLNKHVVVEEISLLQQKIVELRMLGFKDDIYVISPFKAIANHCEYVFKQDKKVSCGTIHRFQGKEADIVFLVLGSDPKSSGARNWASQKPNMLNVALTRAKKRFYVIGNKKLWGNCSYFDTMAEGLN